jgi:malonyl-CoA O-methyltransferase
LDVTGSLNGKTILDVGCGKGRFLKVLNRMFPHATLTGLDISEELLNHIPKSISTVQASMHDMPFPDATFDVVFCIEALEHAVAIRQAVAEMCRVLKPGGSCIIIDKNAQELGRVTIPVWEQWFLPDELARVMRGYCTDVAWKSIPYTYDKSVSTDGWFIIWRGVKPLNDKPAT